MKKILILGLLLFAGWAGYSYFSAYMNWVQFSNEVDSFLQEPRALSEENLPPLILNKAKQFGINLDPKDIDVQISATDKETTISGLIGNKGLKAENRIISLHIRATQTILGTTKSYTLDRKRTFTARINN